MSRKNKFGLSDYIREKDKLVIRERCGFGCLICGGIPYHYDHFEVNFADAEAYNPDDIVLLCHKHHDEKTRGALSVSVLREYLSQNPVKDRTAVFDPSILIQNFRVVWPAITLQSLENNIIIDGEEVLGITATGDPRQPITLSGNFYDERGVKICSVSENEFRLPPNDLGDVTYIGQTFLLKSKSEKVILKFSMTPKLLIIDEIYIVKNRAFLIANNEYFYVGNGDSYGDFSGAMLLANRNGIVINSGLSPLSFRDGNIQLPHKSFSGRSMTVSHCDTAISWG